MQAERSDILYRYYMLDIAFHFVSCQPWLWREVCVYARIWIFCQCIMKC